MGAGTRAGRRKRSDAVSPRKAGPRRESSELGVREHRSAGVEPEGLREWVGRVWGWQQSPRKRSWDAYEASKWKCHWAAGFKSWECRGGIRDLLTHRWV